MLFLRLILKNLFSRKIRTILTIVGISIGIATIVIFGMVSNGLKNSMATALKPGTADFTVAKADVADMILSVLTKAQLDTIRSVEGVAEVIPYNMTIQEYRSNPYFILGGIHANQADLLGAKITEGRLYQSDNEVAVGRIAAKNYDLKVGQQILLGKKQYDIVGIFESGVTMQDGGAVMTIEETQRLNSFTEGQVSMAMVNVVEGYEPRDVADSVEARDSKLICVVDVNDYMSIDQGLHIINSVSWAISILAMVIGGIGVMNTIIMSVFERTHEIGVMRAVGWKRRRVMAMILGEAFVLSLGAAIIGIAIGLGITWLMMQTDFAKSWLDISYESNIFVRSLLVAVVVVILGALYPAYRASRFSPIEALRYE